MSLEKAAPEVVLAALEIVKSDYETKLSRKKHQTTSPLSNV